MLAITQLKPITRAPIRNWAAVAASHQPVRPSRHCIP